MENESRKFKILWNSNAIHAPTGYGLQTNGVCFPLLEQGFDVRVATNYGLEAAALGFNGLIQYPKLFAEYGEDALKLIIENWKPDVLITLYDVWVGGRSKFFGVTDWFAKLHPRWIPWVPVDHMPIPDPVANQARLAYKPVAMSQFGKKELERVGIKCDYIPHGTETDVFKPLDKKECRAWLNKHSVSMDKNARIKYDPNDFILALNCANKDPFRKDFARMFIAGQIFLDNNPDAKKDFKFHVHAWIRFPGGFDLEHLAKKLEMSKYMKYAHPYDMYVSMSLDDMARMYGGIDVLINLARGGGFEIAMLESMSCGVPVIATDYTAMTELVKGHGWLVPPFASKIKCPTCNDTYELLNSLSELTATLESKIAKKELTAIEKNIRALKRKAKRGNFSYGTGALQFSHLMSLYAIPDEWKAAEAIVEAAEQQPEKFGKLLEKVDNKEISVNAAHIQVRRAEKHINPPELPDGEFDVIYADPPWKYDFCLEGNPQEHYNAMTTEDICGIHVPSAKDAILFLWATNPKIEDALKVAKAWGFKYVTNLVWIKQSKGLGYYSLAQHELLFIRKKRGILADSFGYDLLYFGVNPVCLLGCGFTRECCYCVHEEPS